MNIAVIILDTTRGDVVNSLINSGELPAMTELSRQGQWYTDARANGPWTVPSHGSIFTGEYPSESGINGRYPSYQSVPLVEVLNDVGYQTGGFSANTWLTPEFGFGKPFDTFLTKYDYADGGISLQPIVKMDGSPRDRAVAFARGLRGASVTGSGANTLLWAYQRLFRKDTGGRHLMSRAADWLTAGDRRFAFINLTEPHLSYRLPKEWLPDGMSHKDVDALPQETADYNAGTTEVSEQEFDALKGVYTATLKYVDHLIGTFVSRVGDDTAIIIAGDHGEHFGEHKRFGHQYSLHRELLHVPLVAAGPGIPAKQIEHPVELRGLYGFIQSLARGDAAELPAIREHIAELMVPRPTSDDLTHRDGAALKPFVSKYADGARSISTSDGKLVEFASGEVEVIEASPASECRQNLKDTLQERLHARRGDFNPSQSEGLDVSSAVASQLEELGYM